MGRTRTPAQTQVKIAIFSQGDAGGTDEGSSEMSLALSLVRLLEAWDCLTDEDRERLAVEAERLAEAFETPRGS